jgi:DNA-binding NarL/FixJ family response regulator
VRPAAARTRTVAGQPAPPDGSQAHPVPASCCRPSDLGLTARQSDVLYQILQGKSVKVIGRDLGLSPSTVKAHTTAVLRALNVTTRTQAIIAASKCGLCFDGVAGALGRAA